jgi:hypothetical protein
MAIRVLGHLEVAVDQSPVFWEILVFNRAG